MIPSLIVTPTIGTRSGNIVTHIEGVLALFRTDLKLPEVDKPVSIMITGVSYQNRLMPGADEANEKVRFVFVTPVNEDQHVLVHHSGFECMGTTQSTLARATEHPVRLSPGKVGVYVANNVNPNWMEVPGDPASRVGHEPRIPGFAYVDRDSLETAVLHKFSRPVRIEGVVSINEMNFMHPAKSRTRTQSPSIHNIY